MKNNFTYYWQEQFNDAYEMLKEKLYLPDGYNYGKDKGIENDNFIKMIFVKSCIQVDIRKGIIGEYYKSYAIEIWDLLGIRGGR